MSDPDGYYHTLLDYEEGHVDGSAYCHGWYSGTIVYGQTYEILGGCS